MKFYKAASPKPSQKRSGHQEQAALTARGHIPLLAQHPAMEANHMSPNPTAPTLTTSGDNPCRMDVTDMAIDGVTALICLCGLLGNGAVLWFLGFRIRRNPITVYIFNLAIADFVFLLSMLTSSLLYMTENVSCSTLLSLKYKRSLFLFSLFSYNTALYLLTAISIERCMSIFCYSIRHPQRLSVTVCVLLWSLSITVIAAVTSLCLLYDHEHCRMALISMYILNFLVFAPPMVISSTILLIKQFSYTVVPSQVAFRRVFEEPADNMTFSSDTTMDTLAPAC
ncbi:mas-related G-protein coupled receptor member H [Patagioenas fasciata monilis]|uniref:Mas-related G-protein coupled receptor member H n=1 Tax=Patagioenas fasciata monilis TaxID=372326 RepID=A0A1V4JPI2_PATFA|nr:mas-related G-protein coupled receptor member H [Patagioenas fasciata monilis]